MRSIRQQTDQSGEEDAEALVVNFLHGQEDVDDGRGDHDALQTHPRLGQAETGVWRESQIWPIIEPDWHEMGQIWDFFQD